MEIDTQAIQEAVSLAGDAGSSVGNIAKALDAVTGLFGRPEGAADPDVKLAIANLKLEVANARETNALLVTALREVSEELAKAQARQTDFDRYELVQTTFGHFVLALKEDADGGEPMHYICPTCAEKGEKSVLQGGGKVLECYPCGKYFRTDEEGPLPRMPRRGIV